MIDVEALGRGTVSIGLAFSRRSFLEQVIQTANSKPTIAVRFEQHVMFAAGIGLTVIVG
jgi:hypothetical protein